MRGMEAGSVEMDWREMETYGTYRREKILLLIILATFDLAQSLLGDLDEV